MKAIKTIAIIAKALQENKSINKVVRFTQIFVIAITLVLIFLDVFLYSSGETTISQYINELAYGNWFVFSFIWGVLASHMFFTRESRAIKSELISIIAVVALSVLVYFSHYFINGDSILTQLVFLVLGGIAGYFIWPQTFDKQPENKLGSLEG
jgi:hypothetical protein